MFKTVINLLLIFALVLPSFCLAQNEASQMPETMEEAKSFGLKMVGDLPGAVKKVWQEQVLPLWQKMWQWFVNFIEPWWQKFLGLLGKETPDVKKEFQKETQEMKEDIPNLWERFKDLLK